MNWKASQRKSSFPNLEHCEGVLASRPRLELGTSRTRAARAVMRDFQSGSTRILFEVWLGQVITVCGFLKHFPTLRTKDRLLDFNVSQLHSSYFILLEWRSYVM
jgi:hypothetical protein